MMRKLAIAAFALLAACSKPALDPATPEGYAMVLPVTPSGENGVHRVDLPPRAVAALQRDDAGDVRIFDGEGRPLSLALADTASRLEGQRTVALKAVPIAMPRPAAKGSVSVRVDQDQQSVTVDAVDPQAAAQTTPEAALLFDTRKLDDPVLALELDAKLPKGMLIEVSVAASGDLKSWEPLASKVLLGTEEGTAPDLRLAMPGLPLTDRYVRLSWQLTNGVKISGAKAITARIPPPRPMMFATRGANLDDDHTLRFDVLLGVTLIGVRITGQSGEGVVPLTLAGRNSAEEPWQQLAQGALRNGSSAQLDFPTIHLAEYRVIADPRSPGFAAMPRVELLTAPIVLLAAFNAKPPYTLALGNAGAPSAFFERAELLGRPRSDATLPGAQVTAGPAQILKIEPAGAGLFSPRKLALWAALLAATALLAFLALRLLRQSRVKPTD
ncbi:DUF3999 family protein [Novosphingobium sp.]|uniref:DUF3999 family protein n=1 Tax=Novosphingobium sp. TaxID=1874826 RepID=UPI002869EFF7|nr:DUF3999 family protein [Novosphingobium sp.]